MIFAKIECLKLQFDRYVLIFHIFIFHFPFATTVSSWFLILKNSKTNKLKMLDEYDKENFTENYRNVHSQRKFDGKFGKEKASTTIKVKLSFQLLLFLF